MNIRCKIERKGGSVVSLDGVSYHFKPESDAPKAPHVCNVDDEAHLARLLSITEGYEIHGAAIKAQSKPDDDDDDDDAIEVDGDPVAIVLADTDGATDEQIAAAFEALNGRAPNPKAKRETVLKRIIEAADAIPAVD